MVIASILVRVPVFLGHITVSLANRIPTFRDNAGNAMSQNNRILTPRQTGAQTPPGYREAQSLGKKMAGQYVPPLPKNAFMA